MRLASYHSDYLTTFNNENNDLLSKSQHLTHITPLELHSEEDREETLSEISPYLSAGLDFQSNRSLINIPLLNGFSTLRSRPPSLTGLGFHVDDSSGLRSSIDCNLHCVGEKAIHNSPTSFTLTANDLFDDFEDFNSVEKTTYNHEFKRQSRTTDQFLHNDLYETQSFKPVDRSRTVFDSPDLDLFSSFPNCKSEKSPGSRIPQLMPNFIVDINMFQSLRKADERVVKPTEVMHKLNYSLDESSSCFNKPPQEKPQCQTSFSFDPKNSHILVQDGRDVDCLNSLCDKPRTPKPKSTTYLTCEQKQKPKIISENHLPQSVFFNNDRLQLQPEVTVIFESLLTGMLPSVDEYTSQIPDQAEISSLNYTSNTYHSNGGRHNLGKKNMIKPGQKNCIASKILFLMQSHDSSSIRDFPIVDPHRGISEDTVAHKVASYKLMHFGEKLPDTLLFCFAGKQVQCKSGAGIYICYILNCGKTTKRKDHMADHIRTHLGEKPFQCRTCGMGFIRSNDCLRHESNHSSEKKFICNCNAAFSRRDLFVRHKRTSCAKPINSFQTFNYDLGKRSECDSMEKQPHFKKIRTLSDWV